MGKFRSNYSIKITIFWLVVLIIATMFHPSNISITKNSLHENDQNEFANRDRFPMEFGQKSNYQSNKSVINPIDSNRTIQNRSIINRNTIRTMGTNQSYTIIEPGSISYVGYSTSVDNGTAGTKVTVDKPIGTKDGDFMIAFLASTLNVNNNGANISTPPNGWTEEFDFINMATKGEHVYLYWKFTGSSEPSNYTWYWDLNSAWVATIVTLRGVNSTSPIHVLSSTLSGTSQDPISPSVTTTSDNIGIISYFVEDDNDLITGNMSPPSGTTLIDMNASSNTLGNGLGFGLSIYNQTIPGVTGNQIWLGALGLAEEWTGLQIGILPESTIISVSFPEFVNVPSNMTLVEGTPGINFNFTAIDDSPNQYRVYRNGSIQKFGSWINNSETIISTDDLQLGFGINNITIIIDNTFNNESSYTFFINVIDLTNPVISSAPEDINIIVGTSGNTVEWLFSDLHPGFFEVYNESKLIEFGNWINSVPVKFNLDNLSLGIHNYTIIAFDSSNNMIQDSIFVTVGIILTQVPQITLEKNFYQGYTDHITGFWLAEDGTEVPSGNVTVYLNNSIIETANLIHGVFQLNLFYDFRPGDYNLSFMFDHLSYQGQLVEYSITIHPHQLLIDLQYDDLIPGEEFLIVVQIIYNDQSNSPLSLNTVGSKVGGVQNITLSLFMALEYNNGNIENIELVNKTNSEGIAVFTLSRIQTANLRSINYMNVIAMESENVLGVEYEIMEINLPKVYTDSNGQKDSLYDLINILVKNLYFSIGIILIFLGISGSMILRSKRERGNGRYIESPFINPHVDYSRSVILRLSEIHCIKAILIMDYQSREPVFVLNYSNEEHIQDVIGQITASYTDLDVIEDVSEFIINSMDRSLDELLIYDFINVERILGDVIDIYLISQGEIPEIAKSLTDLENVLNMAYNLKTTENLSELFNDNYKSISYQIHMLLDTWALHDLSVSENVDISKIRDEDTKDVINLINKNNNIALVDIVGNFKGILPVNVIYEIIHKQLGNSSLTLMSDDIVASNVKEKPVMFMVIQTHIGGRITSCHFTEKGINETLLAGLISAIQSMSQSIFETKGVIENINYDKYTIAFRFRNDIMYSYVFSGPSISLQKKFDKFFKIISKLDWLEELRHSIVIKTNKSDIKELDTIINDVFTV